MKSPCSEWEQHFERGHDHDARAEWDAHLASCSGCRDHTAMDAALRRSFSGVGSPAEQIDERLDAWLTAELAKRTHCPQEAASDRRWRLSARERWVLVAYGAAASLVSLRVLSTVSWPAVSPAVPLTALGVLAVLTPLVLFDRLGVLRPPA